MRTGSTMDPPARNSEEARAGQALAMPLLAWEGDTSPRLQPSDLADPTQFYRRLETYIMNQK